MQVHIYMHPCENQRTTLGVVSHMPVTLFFEAGSLAGRELTEQSRL